MKTLVLTALLLVPAFAATPAETAIQQSMAAIAREPGHYAFYNDLAVAYARRARETSDARFYGKAQEALAKSFALAPANFEGRKMEVRLDLARQEFSVAGEKATKLNKEVPDDISIYGYLVDANTELGNDQEAVDAAQWMLDLRPGNVAGLESAAGLRELHGMLPGAIEFLQLAYDATPFAETEERAWILTRMSHVHLAGGDLAQAESTASQALKVFPDYPLALDGMGRVRLAQTRYAEAVDWFRKRYQAVPDAEALYALAEAQELAGCLDDAHASFAQFEKLATNRELVAYYVDHAHNPAKALEIARGEIARRHDVFTLDAYAWALAAAGDLPAARAEMRKALALGTKDPKLLAHARSIEGR